ncbi:MAG: hypothetical protein IJ609_03650, partial [Paludibacteraceae bacterium]|nr:hypothetical protein [Paludibacteraceae bacterium]
GIFFVLLQAQNENEQPYDNERHYDSADGDGPEAGIVAKQGGQGREKVYRKNRDGSGGATVDVRRADGGAVPD